MTRMHIFPRDVAYLFLSVNEIGKKSQDRIILGSFVKKNIISLFLDYSFWKNVYHWSKFTARSQDNMGNAPKNWGNTNWDIIKRMGNGEKHVGNCH